MDPPTDPTEKRHYAYYTRARCRCGSHKLKAYRTTQNGDGSLTRHSRCRDCGAKLIVVAE